ncbi:uncharacterized protein LOC135503270 [Lineus longissimus]|uniref:uncharacterized protein LOC135503270 n=1 Tax=Lineus longissimus TaxID=88925 RepID=UPI002B4EED5E
MSKVVGVPDQQEAEIRIAAANLNQTVEDEYLWLTCGTIMGKLHKNRFYCPGIHMECIEVEEELMVTPKMFVKMGEKERLKDWKTAVRVNGIPIRRYMEAGHLDFYRHKETCTMRCLSRATTLPRPELNLTEVGSIKETTFNWLENDSVKTKGQPISLLSKNLHGAKVSKPSQRSRAIPVSLVAATPISGRSTPEQMQTVFINASHGTVAKTAAANSLLRLNMADLKAGVVAKENGSHGNVMSFLKTLDNGASSDGADANMESEATHDLDPEELSMFEHCRDSQVFWRGILQVGILDNVMQDIISAVQKLKLELVMSSVGKEESKRLTKLVEQLGIMKQIRGKVAKQRGEMQQQKDQLKKEMEDLKKRVAEAEMKQYELKRKSECFDQLIEMSMKRPNLSMPSPAPSDWSEQSTVGEDMVESEQSESNSHSDERGVRVGGKRSRKAAKTNRIPPTKETVPDDLADENSNTCIAEGKMKEDCASDSGGDDNLTSLKSNTSEQTAAARKRGRYSDDEDYTGGEDEDDDD